MSINLPNTVFPVLKMAIPPPKINDSIEVARSQRERYSIPDELNDTDAANIVRYETLRALVNFLFNLNEDNKTIIAKIKERFNPGPLKRILCLKSTAAEKELDTAILDTVDILREEMKRVELDD